MLAACPPQPGLGSVTYSVAHVRHVVDLGSCLTWTVAPRAQFGKPRVPTFRSPDGRAVAFVRVTKREQTIVVRRAGRARPVLRVGEVYRVVDDDHGPIWLIGWSPDSRWLLYTIDPDGSGSIAADGLRVRVVPASGGRPRTIARMLVYDDYLIWCGRRLIVTAGMARESARNKRLVFASAPDWRPHPLVRAPTRAFGSIQCAPDGRSLVAQSAPTSRDPRFFATRWALWRVGLDGSLRQLTSPPPGYADDSPRWSRDGRAILFVRSHRGSGKLYAWRDGRVAGPFASVGYRLGYYGHRDWWQGLTWSLASRR